MSEFTAPTLIPRRRVSVALATYRGEQYLREQLDSIARQSCAPYEVVISDDHSPDGTLRVAREFAEGAPFPVRILTNDTPLRGVLGNFFNAFAHCNGDIISYCDQDDVWHPRKLETCLAPFTDPRVVLVIHRSRITDEHLNDMGYGMPHIPVDRVVRWPSFINDALGLGHQMLFDPKILRTMAGICEEAPPGLTRIAGCFDCIIPMAAGMHGDIHYLARDLMYFRRHDGSTSPAGKVTSPSGLKSRAEAKRQIVATFATELRAVECWLATSRSVMRSPVEEIASYKNFIASIARQFEARAAIYGGATWMGRIRAWMSATARGAYRAESKGGLGRKAFLQDLVILSLNGARVALRDTLTR